MSSALASATAAVPATHLRQHTRLGPACEPPPQGRAAGLRRCRGQAAPGRALAQEPPQGGQHSDRLGRRMAATALPGWITVVDDRRKQAQDPDIQGSLPCLASQTWASAAARSVASQSTVVVKTASKSLSRNSRRALGSQVHAPKGSASGPEIGPKNSYSDPLWRNLKGRERVSGRALSSTLANLPATR